MAGKSVTETGTFLAIFAVPEFPGATKRLPHFSLCANFQVVVSKEVAFLKV